MLELIAHNGQHALFSNDQATKLISVENFNLIGTLPISCKIGYIQEGKSIAALVNQSKICIYDFANQSDVYDFQSNLKICKIGLLKNLIIAISNQRILIHDTRTKSNKFYIPIQQGELAFFSNDYYLLKIEYFTQPHVLSCREYWLNKINKIEGVKFTQGFFAPDCQKIALVTNNVLSIYNQKELLRLYGFDYDIEQVVAVGPYFFVKLEDQAVIGCGVDKQVNFLQFEQILVDFWDHQHQSILIAGKQELYEMGKGLVRKYRLQHAQEYNQNESKKIKKQPQIESG